MSSAAPAAAPDPTAYVMANERGAEKQLSTIRKLYDGFIATAKVVRSTYHLRSRALLRRARHFDGPGPHADSARARNCRVLRYQAYTTYVAELRRVKEAFAAIAEPPRVYEPGPAERPADARAAERAAYSDTLANVSDEETGSDHEAVMQDQIDEVCRTNDDLAGFVIDASNSAYALVRQRLILASHELAGRIAATTDPVRRRALQRQFERLTDHASHAFEALHLVGENGVPVIAPSISDARKLSAMAGVPTVSRALFLRDVGSDEADTELAATAAVDARCAAPDQGASAAASVAGLAAMAASSHDHGGAAAAALAGLVAMAAEAASPAPAPPNARAASPPASGSPA